jgi:hypothetical protein
MLGDIAIWIAVLVLVVVLIAGYAYEPTRPYIKKYGWMAAVVGTGLVGLVLFRRTSGNSIDVAIDDGRDIADRNDGAMDSIVDYAAEQMASADADLARQNIEIDFERDEFDQKRDAINTVDDSVARRKALIELVGKA